MNKDSQAIIILCSNLCVGDGIDPFKPSEWKILAGRLLEKKMAPGDLLDMSEAEIIDRLECDTEYATRIVKLTGRSASLFFEVSRYENIGINIVTRADKEYPRRIKARLGDSCPPFFFYSGDLSLLNKKSIGFVGSRDMDAPDADFEAALVSDAVKNKYAIVSGGARGADSISEEAALNNGGKMIEFLADSMIDKLCKSKIIKAVQSGELLVLSVVNPDAHFSVGNAMNRNKYIYAQSDAVIAIKSVKRGGTWSGVNENLKRGYCPVYCWNNEKYADNLALIKNGAISIDDGWGIKDLLKSDEVMTVAKKNDTVDDQQLMLFQ